MSRPVRCEPCGKLRYLSQDHAVHVVLRCLRLRGGSLRIYECPIDPGMFHITKKTKKAPRTA